MSMRLRGLRRPACRQWREAGAIAVLAVEWLEGRSYPLAVGPLRRSLAWLAHGWGVDVMLNPTGIALIAAALSGALVAGSAGWVGRGLVFDHIERPAIVQAATDKANDAATIRIMDAAKRAEDAERERQQRASAEALRIYREALANSERAALEAQTRLDQEIAAYESELATEGRSCVLTDTDIDWLYGRVSASAN